MKLSLVFSATLICMIALARPAASDCEVTDTAGDMLTPGSLGACITSANGNGTPDVITFNISVAGGGLAVILPLQEYVITEPGTIIDGYSQPLSSANSSPAPGPLNTTLTVSVDGSDIAGPGVAVFRIETDDTTIRGLNIHSGPVYEIAIGMETSGCSNNRVQGCFIGTDIDGSIARPSGWLPFNPPFAVGVYLMQGAANNFIGSDGEGADGAAERNLLSGESRDSPGCGYGVLIDGGQGTASGNVIDGNLIGTSVDAVTPLGNNLGVAIMDAAFHSVVANNVIAGNSNDGIRMECDASGCCDSTEIFQNLVSGNYWNGISMSGAHTNSDIGPNQVEQNSRDGILCALGDDSNNCHDNTIQSNVGHGIELNGSSAQIDRNTISGNGGWGINNHPFPGGDFSPAGAGNDVVGRPAIAGNSIDANGSGGIASFDCRPLRSEFLHTDNDIGDNSDELDVQQLWFGTVEILDASNPPPVTTGAYTVTLVDAEGSMQSGAVQDGGLWGPSGFDSGNVITWFFVLEYEVDSAGSFHQHNPYTIVLTGPTGGTGTYTFDGADNDVDDCNTGGCSPAGILTGGQFRYQVAEVAVRDDSDGDGVPDGADCAPFDPGFQGGGGTPCDADSDGYCDNVIAVGVRPADCPGETGCTTALCKPSDCLDSDPGVHPGSSEGPAGDPTCSDSIDNDCDDTTDSADPGCTACLTDEDCDDANVCTDDTCSGGACLHPAVPDGMECDDGLYCTDPDTCSSGVCGGPPRDCPDMILCTTGTCDETMNICFPQPVPDGTPCDDSDACSMNDVCTSGACAGVPLDADSDNHVPENCGGDDCDDFDAGVHPGAAEVCDDGVDNDCDGSTDTDDTDCACATDADCDDDNPCTDDTCDPPVGCRHSSNTAACDDGDACTMNDACSESLCQGEPLDADSDSYVSDSCGGDDCDDADAGVNPGASEICDDDVDNDCDGEADSDDDECGGSTGGCDCSAINPGGATLETWLLLLGLFGVRRRSQEKRQAQSRHCGRCLPSAKSRQNSR